jgi:hypothetical protein
LPSPVIISEIAVAEDDTADELRRSGAAEPRRPAHDQREGCGRKVVERLLPLATATATGDLGLGCSAEQPRTRSLIF